MIKIKSSMHAKEFMGKRFHWEEHSNRYIFKRSGILTQVHRGQLSFDDSHDYKPPRDFRNLTVEGGRDD